MIYIFDDKKKRQEGYKWSNEKFRHHKDYVVPIYHYRQIQNDEDRKKIFSEGNTILFHESFFDTDFNRHDKDAIVIRRELEEFAQANLNFSLAFFSGSKSSRVLDKNVAYLPVSTLYQNLEEFIQQSKCGVIDLKYLLYGKTPNVEQDLFEKLRSANASLLNSGNPFEITNSDNILISTTINSDRLPQIVIGAKYKMNLNGDSDTEMHNIINSQLRDILYDKIFIPLCFGTSLSDFNGLRLAAHIRCTDTVNRYTPIFIYGFVKIDELINHEYFNILKQKGIQLIDYTVNAFKNVIKSKFEKLDCKELPIEMSTLKLDVPEDYEDSHSISNEWAIYRWANAINADDYAIQKITEKIKKQLYFKYLNTIYPTSEMSIIGESELQIKNNGKARILYVDDDAEKGWIEIICRILSDLNYIEKIDYLGDELKLITQEEIIEKTILKIKEGNIDLVILDFRLHPNDFDYSKIDDVTGYKILKEIKNRINRGIQVIIFSATNKMWNLQALQKAHADGFIIKESPENSKDVSFTYKSITEGIKSIEICIDRIFIKDLFKNLKIIEDRLFQLEYSQQNKKFIGFINKLKSQFKILYSGVDNIRLSSPITLDVVFLACYALIDLFKKYYLFKDQDYRYYLGYEKEELIRFSVNDNTVVRVGPFIPNDHYEKPGVFHVYAALLKNYYKIPAIYDVDMYIKSFHRVKDYRNDYIHGDSKKSFSKEEVMQILDILLPLTSNIIE